MTKLQWKFLAIAAAVILAAWLLFLTFIWYRLSAPEREKKESMKDPLITRIIKLGLDLRGGTHLVLELDTGKIDSKTVQEQKLAINEAADRAIEILRNRVDQFGVAEPSIARQGEKWIVVQLPGIDDPERAKDPIGKTALLEFKLVHPEARLEIEKIIAKLNEKGISVSSAAAHPESMPKEALALVPTGYALMNGREEGIWLIKSQAELTGSTLVDARVQMGSESSFGTPEVAIEFNPEGAKIFADVTQANINRPLAIVLDGVVQSAPTIQSVIGDGKAQITGRFTEEDAKLLKTILKAGALPVPIRIIEERTVGPTLGEDSIRAGVLSSVIGMSLVLIFMGTYYKGGGMVTDVALILNFFLLMAAMAYFQATLTLPGIAGMILSVGMAVDANVLILERTREELRNGKTVRMALDLGYDRAFSAILDTNVTTLIAALFLFQFGTGPVKGFAVTLSIGIIMSMFTAVFVTRTYYDWRVQDKNFTEISI